MAELRWLLLVVGLVVVAGIYVYARLKPRLERGFEAMTARREPTLVGQADSTVGPEAEPEIALSIPELEVEQVSAPEHVFEQESTPLPGEIPVLTDESKIIAIRLMSREHTGFSGEKLILTMRELGLQHGEFGIFHQPTDVDDRYTEFSVASLTEPGSFDLTRIKTDLYPGVSIFMQLPGTRDGVEIFDDMLRVSRSLALRMNGDLLDEQGSTLSVQRERYLREEVIQFQHQGLS